VVALEIRRKRKGNLQPPFSGFGEQLEQPVKPEIV
jgi:hypothetical protein